MGSVVHCVMCATGLDGFRQSPPEITGFPIPLPIESWSVLGNHLIPSVKVLGSWYSVTRLLIGADLCSRCNT